jgi:hypothetical protein
VEVAEEATDGISEADCCAGAGLAQLVRIRRTTPAEAKWPLRGRLMELII